MLKEKKLKNGNTVLTGATPKGIASYVKVYEPQTKVGETTVEPFYSATIYMNGKDPAVETLMTQLGEQLRIAEEMATEQASKVKGRKPKLPKCNDENFGSEYDENGNETGRYYIRAKAKASGITPNGKKWSFKPAVFDGSNVPFPEKNPPLIGNGSTIRFGITAFPYAQPIGYGVSIRLDAIQVIDLVEYNGKSAESFGFEVEANSYKVSKEDEKAAVFYDEEEEREQPTSYRDRMTDEDKEAADF